MTFQQTALRRSQGRQWTIRLVLAGTTALRGPKSPRFLIYRATIFFSHRRATSLSSLSSPRTPQLTSPNSTIPYHSPIIAAMAVVGKFDPKDMVRKLLPTWPYEPYEPRRLTLALGVPPSRSLRSQGLGPVSRRLVDLRRHAKGQRRQGLPGGRMGRQARTNTHAAHELIAIRTLEQRNQLLRHRRSLLQWPMRG